jgi:hypothetical protein
MRTWLIITIMLGPVVAYWLSIISAARRLPRQRRQIGDARPVPGLFDPATSHRWLGIILTEDTSQFSPRAKRAFWIAQLSVCLIPFGFILAMVIANNGVDER